MTYKRKKPRKEEGEEDDVGLNFYSEPTDETPPTSSKEPPPPVKYIDGDELVRELDPGNPCWGCINGFTTTSRQSKTPHASHLYDMYRTKMQELPFSSQVPELKKAFYQHVYTPTKGKSGIWPERQIRIHLKYHMQIENAAMNTNDVLMKNLAMLENVANSCFFIDPVNGNRTPNPKSIEQFQKLSMQYMKKLSDIVNGNKSS